MRRFNGHAKVLVCTLTDEGERLEDAADAEISKVDREIESNFSADELQQFRSFLSCVEAVLLQRRA